MATTKQMAMAHPLGCAVLVHYRMAPYGSRNYYAHPAYSLEGDARLDPVLERLLVGADGDYVLDGVPEPLRVHRTYGATLTAFEQLCALGYAPQMRGCGALNLHPIPYVGGDAREVEIRCLDRRWRKSVEVA